MSTVLSQAFKEAGIAMPLNRRVWMWVKDHPGKTSREIASGINFDKGRVQNALLDLEIRGMVKATPVYQRHYSGKGRKTQNEYTAIGDQYELLPIRKTSPGKSSPVAVVKSEPVAPVQPVRNVTVDVDSLPLAEARRIYERLKEIFG